jgi:tRNA(adenine34) deaminase
MNSRHDTCRHDRCDSNPATRLYSRRGIVIALASTTVLCAEPPFAAAYASANDRRFMRLALDEARQGDYPFGAVIARDGQVIARGRNLGKANDDPTAHGVMVVIRRCLADHGSAALRGSTLYTSGEPCAMCMGAILWSHIGRLVFAASLQQLATKIDQIMIPCADIAANAAVRADHDHGRRAGGRSDEAFR